MRSEPSGAKRWTLVLVNLAAIVEKADEAVLPAVYLYVGRAFGVGPKELGVLTLCRALSQVRPGAAALRGGHGHAACRSQSHPAS
jgi:hypothetical protein